MEGVKCFYRNILYYGQLKKNAEYIERYLTKGSCENRKRMELAHYGVEWPNSLLEVLKLVILLSQSDLVTFCGKFLQQIPPKFPTG
jgi:hypothetical protein